MNEYKQELCRRYYSEFFPEFCSFDYVYAKYHDILFDIIQDIAEGKPRRVLLDLPPRHMKSESIGRKGVPYLLGRRPDLRVIYGSYSDELPAKFSRETRRLIKSPEYRGIFPDTEIEYGSDNIREWNTTKGGAVAWVGVRGGATGKDAEVVIIDDPLKNRKEAESPVIREAVMGEIRASFLTRLEPNGSFIILQTRWHQKDPIGQLCESEGWEHISLPANTKDDLSGDWLFPERFTPDDYKQKRKDLGSYDWNSLYQGNPKPPEGGIWKRAYARVEPSGQHAAVMAMNNWSLYYDLAFSSKMEADETTGAEFLEFDNVVYIRRPITTKQDMAELRGWLANDIIMRGVTTYGVDKAFSQSQFAKELTRLPALKMIRQHPLKGVDVDKLTNFLPILARFEAREVVFIQEADWRGDDWDVWIEKLAEYKAGQSDSPDHLDCVSNGYRMIHTKTKVTTQRSTNFR